MEGLPIIEIGILGIVVLCGFLIYVTVLAPKKGEQKQEHDQ